MIRTNAKKHYHFHRLSAKKRNIGFHFTFEEWDNWWLANGVDKNIKPLVRSLLCMCRKNDTGDYEHSNVYCSTRSQNSKDEHVNLKGKFKLFDGSDKKIVQTPLGIFSSRKDAAAAHNVVPGTIKYRIDNIAGYAYI